MTDWLRSIWCDFAHASFEISRDEQQRLGYRCRVCGRFELLAERETHGNWL